MDTPNKKKAAALRAVPMGMYPTMDTLDSALSLALSQFPIENKNQLLSIMMIYHNTMLRVMSKENTYVPPVDQCHQAYPDHLPVE